MVFMFSSYLNFVYFFDNYKHWFYNDINDFEIYDYIVGKSAIYFLYSIMKFLRLTNIILQRYVVKTNICIQLELVVQVQLYLQS